MRLLNTETLQLELFEGGPKLSYAILSHTWGDDEVTFEDLVTGQAPERKAWSKITSCCAKARTEGYLYVWVDTCCIDKSSSAELSEAINSMFKWYQDAEVCYAYLADVELGPGRQPAEEKEPEEESDSVALVRSVSAALEESRWFTRGWTLQELLAPPDVVFFSATWRELGTRDSLAFLIAMATKIDIHVLKQWRSISSFSVAQRLSWASQRQTSKVEDEAYCLMGLFGVSMPLLYGEGHKAFKRLQLEIMKECYDPSILAWASTDSYASIVGVLASSPAAFEGCETVEWALGGSGLPQNEYGSSGACHDIIGSSLRMHASVIALGEHETNIKLRAYDEGKSLEPEDCVNPLDSLIHFPRGSSYTLSSDFFEFSFLRHKKYSLILALLNGCKDGDHTVGITLCRDSSGLLKRVHYPTRFLVPETWTSSFQPQTLHVSLSGNQVLQKPLVPAWTRCLVRISNLADSPYTLSHTIPATAPDAENCWYLNRWSTALDRVTMTPQPCFSLHQAKAGRAIVFRHAADAEFSFRLVFSTWAKAKVAAGPGVARPLNLCVKAEVGASVLEDGDEAELDGTPDRQLPSAVRRFLVRDRYQVVVKFRRSQQAYTLAIVQVLDMGQVA
ncbi:HET-domain-containing protein [Coniochaeta ligniaria NRRL 30616]|uniref:HET-domain-containing protein n=1 Tax=Coniochaeta ligniaria NRRL 30616 TaxID=1408157 RepID=A0A1J7JEY1_9PEZI|nr:HET-domain-containing protein [Coniochaeta ligniaria NRRL 30616]